MRTFVIAFVVVVLAAMAAMLALSRSRPTPSGEPVTETRPAAGFHRIEVDGVAEVTLVQGASEGVTVRGAASVLPRVRTQVRNGTLVIEAVRESHGWDWLLGGGSAKPVRLTVNLRDVDEVEAAGAVSVAAETLRADALRLDFAGACKVRIGDLQAGRLKLGAAGATKAEIAGKVRRQEVDLSGAGSYEAGRLLSDEASVSVSGAGKALVNVRNTLDVDIAGAGKVEYLGDPKLRQSISGVGKVTRREG